MLFQKLFKEGKNVLKQGKYDVLERRARMKIESSINEIEGQVFDIIEEQKEMLSDIEKLDHIAFGNKTKEINNKQEEITILTEMYEKLFGDIYQTTGVKSAREFFEQEKED